MSDKYLFFEKNVDTKLKKLDQIKKLKWVDFIEIKICIKDILNREIRNIILPTIALYLKELKFNNKLKGSTSQERYSFFVEKYKDIFLINFPQLKCVIDVYSDTFLSNIIDTIFFIDKYQVTIFKELKVKNNLNKVVVPENGDRHLGGKQVCFFYFGNKIIKYKPVNLKINLLLEKIIDLISRESGINCKLPKGVYFDDCSFSEFIKYSPQIKKENIKEVCENAGGLLALIFLLNGNDFHLENVLAKNKYLYLLDSESFFMNLSYGSGRFLENQLIFTGFIEKVIKLRPPMSAMFGGTQVFTSLSQPYLINNFSDNLGVRYIKTSNFKPFNQFKIDKEFLDFKKYPTDVVVGFKKVYKIFLYNKEKIHLIVQDEVKNNELIVRHILRKTSLYSLIIQNMYQPANWPLTKFKIKMNNFLKTLNKDIFSIIKYEINNLMYFDVPYFKSKLNEKDLYYGDKKIKNFFRQTPLERWKKKINILSRKHLDKKIKELDSLLSQRSNGI
jgi:lantibiotic modifying enzyme